MRYDVSFSFLLALSILTTVVLCMWPPFWRRMDRFLCWYERLSYERPRAAGAIAAGTLVFLMSAAVAIEYLRVNLWSAQP